MSEMRQIKLNGEHINPTVRDLKLKPEDLIDKNCKYCYGRGAEGTVNGEIIVCRCVRKAAAKAAGKRDWL